MAQIVDIAVIGAGNRGCKYLSLLAQMPCHASIAAVVEPNPRRAAKASAILVEAGLPDAPVFASCSEMLQNISPQAAVIATPEQLHHKQAMELLDKGVNILIEKPVAVTEEQCREIAEKAARNCLVAGVCHVLRYHPYFAKLCSLATDGSLGDVVSVSHRISVGIDRACHTFVRGPWGKPALTSPMLLSKCCHDMDIITAIVQSRAAVVRSVGGRCFFRAENRPVAAADRCVSCPVERNCSFSAVDLYRRRREWTAGFDPAPGDTLESEVNRQLAEGEYGRCVFACDNEAVDRQVVIAGFENGAVASLTMNLFTAEDSRDTHICLTGGEIHGNGEIIEVVPLRGEKAFYDYSGIASKPYHAGADNAVLEDFIEAVRNPEHKMLTDIAESIESHRICILADRNLDEV